MSNDESDLERRLEDGMAEIRSALDATDGDELPDETAESVRESADAVAEELADASLGELLTASGFEDDSDDVTPADLPMLMQDADTDSVLSLRHLLELADLSDEWSNLDDDERLGRLERIGGDETTDDRGRSVSDLLSSVFSLGSSDKKETAEAENGHEETRDGEDDEDEAESEFLSTENAIAEFSSLFDSIRGDDDEEKEEEEDDDSEADTGGKSGGGSGHGRPTDMHSTMPSSRSDMGSRKRHSTVRKKN